VEPTPLIAARRFGNDVLGEKVVRYDMEPGDVENIVVELETLRERTNEAIVNWKD
jgi:hypothetical protein